MEPSIGIDIGGSGVRGAVVQDGTLGPILSLPLEDRAAATVIQSVAQVVQQLDCNGPVGVCVPGFVQNGVVRESPNFPTWKDLELAREIAQAIGRPIGLLNDANAATLGAWIHRGECEDLLLLALGTGVGGGVMMGGQLLEGAGGTGAELGHIYAGGTRLCGCGGRGCLETWISTTGLLAAAKERDYSPLNGQEVVARADAGETWAIEVCDAAADALGRGLITLVNLFNPDTVLITGGLAGARHRFEDRAFQLLHAQGIGPSVERVKGVWGSRAEDYSILGASRCASPGGQP